jgi:L-asparagine transporter-like permease
MRNRTKKKTKIVSKLTENSFNWLNVLIVLFGLILIFVMWQLSSSRHFSLEAAASIGFLFLCCISCFYFNYRMAKRIRKDGLVSKYPFSRTQTNILLFLTILVGLLAVIPMSDGNPLKQYADTIPGLLIGLFLLITFITWKRKGKIETDVFKKNLLWILLFILFLVSGFFIKS